MDLEQVVVQSPAGPGTQLFLLFHRSGDNPTSMARIGQWFAQAFPQSHVISIGGPHQLMAGGSEWFSEHDCSVTLRQNNIDKVMPQFTGLVKEWQVQTGVTAAATALVGFSQGGIMILEALKVIPELAGRAVILSGSYNTPPVTASLATTVHLIHGDEDEVIPYKRAEQAAEWLIGAGGDVTLDCVEDLPHAIDEKSLQLAINHLKYTVPKRYFDEALSGSTPGQDDVIPMI